MQVLRCNLSITSHRCTTQPLQAIQSVLVSIVGSWHSCFPSIDGNQAKFTFVIHRENNSVSSGWISVIGNLLFAEMVDFFPYCFTVIGACIESSNPAHPAERARSVGREPAKNCCVLSYACSGVLTMNLASSVSPLIDKRSTHTLLRE